MAIPWETVVGYAVGLALLFAVGNLLLAPKRFLWKAAAGGMMGALCLLLLNAVGRPFGLHVAVNPLTAVVVGALGLPGAALVVALTLMA